MSLNTVVLDGKSLTINDIVNVARNGYKVEIDPGAKKAIAECADRQGRVNEGRGLRSHDGLRRPCFGGHPRDQSRSSGKPAYEPCIGSAKPCQRTSSVR
jgi:hypothetical protein